MQIVARKQLMSGWFIVPMPSFKPANARCEAVERGSAGALTQVIDGMLNTSPRGVNRVSTALVFHPTARLFAALEGFGWRTLHAQSAPIIAGTVFAVPVSIGWDLLT